MNDSLQIPGLKVERLLAEGGMGSVHLAVQESLGRTVAIKVLKKFDGPEQSARFFAEGRIVASLGHRNIITIYDIGRVGDCHYIAMEYLKGGSLAQRIREGMSLSSVLDVLEAIGGCLDFVHSKGVVHRDVKPDNILFHEDGTPKLTDFGIAKQVDGDQDLTMDGSAFGSPYYLSPEQACGKPLDGRSDIYALGIIFFEMLTGQKPYQDDSHVQTIVAHLNEPIPLLPARLSTYQELLELMIAKAPEDRFASAAELVGYVRGLRVAAPSARAPRARSLLASMSPRWAPRAASLLSSLPLRSARRATWVLASLSRRWAPPARSLFSLLPLRWSRRLTVTGREPAFRIGAGVALVAAAVGLSFWEPRAGTTPEAPDKAEMPLVAPAPAPPAKAAVEPVSEEAPAAVAVAATRVVPTPASASPDPLSPQNPAGAAPVPEPAVVALPSALDRPAEDPVGQVPDSAPAPVGEIEPEPLATKASLEPVPEPPAPASVEPEVPPDPDAVLAESIAQWLAAAEHSMQKLRLTTPEEDSAYFYYQKILAAVPDHAGAIAGMTAIADRYAAMARSQLKKGKDARARVYVQRGIGVEPDHAGLLALRRELNRPPSPEKGTAMPEAAPRPPEREPAEADLDDQSEKSDFARGFRNFWRSLVE